jgi:hypothetical protein
MSKFKVGDRVKFTDKAVCSDKRLDRVSYIEIEKLRGDGRVDYYGSYDFAGKRITGCGCCSDEDFELLITEGGAQMARKTYKLIKDTPTIKKGAIYQEACDDGTQEYVLLDKSFLRGSWPTNSTIKIFDRSLVEDAPQFFVEVFQVEPQYMTAPELEQWDAFKATKTKKLVAKVEAVVTKSAWTPARRKAQSAKIKAAWAAKKAA